VFPEHFFKWHALASQGFLAKIDQAAQEGPDFQKILEIAQDEKLSFYDSSYLYFAKQKGLILITEDKQLEAKAKKHVNVRTVATLLS
jgi:predicted nucleic acid-binding protein